MTGQRAGDEVCPLHGPGCVADPREGQDFDWTDDRQDVIDTVTEEAVRGFFFEKHLPSDTADEWTDQIMQIVKEHR